MTGPKKRTLLLLCISIYSLFIANSLRGQDDQASLLLDLKKARASFEIARQKMENDKKLFENKAISAEEYNQSRNELLSKEVDYQKLILRVIAQQSYIIVEKAVKYQTADGRRRVKITLLSTMEGNQEYIRQFEEHFDVFTPEMRSSKIYNVFVSLVDLKDKTIVGSPYEFRIPVIDLGGSQDADFDLLKDMESLQVKLSYGGRQDEKNIYLEKGSGANVVDMESMQFSQEADLGASAEYDLTLERFSSDEDVYSLIVLNLPRQVSYEFIDKETNARLSQIKFIQGVNTKKLLLRTYLPDRDDEDVVIDRPLTFYAIVLSRIEREEIIDSDGKKYSAEEINAFSGGRVKLELLPRGVGKIEVRALSLYHEITVGESVAMDVTIRNNGTRRLDNIRISTDNPLNWRSVISPELIKSLDPEKEEIVHLLINPPDDVGVGAQEVKIKTNAIADNRSVESDDKTVRIQVQAETPIFWTALLIVLLIGLVLGIVIFGIKISRR